jgi:hypothetical protein
MTVSFGTETFPSARPTVAARVLTIIGGAAPVCGRMLDGVLADNGPGWLCRNAGRLVTTLSGVVAQFGGVVTLVGHAVPQPGSVVPGVRSFITLVSQTVPAAASTFAGVVVTVGVVLTHGGAHLSFQSQQSPATES